MKLISIAIPYSYKMNEDTTRIGSIPFSKLNTEYGLKPKKWKV